MVLNDFVIVFIVLGLGVKVYSKVNIVNRHLRHYRQIILLFFLSSIVKVSSIVNRQYRQSSIVNRQGRDGAGALDAGMVLEPRTTGPPNATSTNNQHWYIGYRQPPYLLQHRQARQIRTG